MAAGRSRFNIETVFRGIDRVSAPVSRMQNRIGRFVRTTQNRLRSIQRHTERMNRAIFAGLRRGAFLLAGGVTALTLSVNTMADNADELVKQADRLDMPVEQLQEWNFVAEQGGVSAENLGTALEGLNQRLGDAAQGSGSLYSMLSRTDRELLQALQTTDNTAQAFEILMDAMRNAEDPMRRMALAQAAFGRQGRALINVAQMSASEVDKLRAQMRDAGVITDEMARSAEEYNDTMNLLRHTVRGVANEALAPLLPMMNEAAEATRQWLQANRELIQSQIVEWGTYVIQNFDEIVDRLKAVGIALAALLSLNLVLKTLIGTLTVLNLVMAANPISLIIIGVMALIGAIVALVANWDRVTEMLRAGINRVAGWFERMAEQLPGPVTAAFNYILDTWRDIVRVFTDDSYTFSDAWDDAVDRIKGILSDFRDWVVGFLPDFMLDARLTTPDMPEGTRAQQAPPTPANMAARIGDWLGDISPVQLSDHWPLLRQLQQLQRGELPDRRRDSDDTDDQARATWEPGSTTVSQSETTARVIQERRQTSEVTIRDETGRAEQTGRVNRNNRLRIERTGAFNA